VEYDWSKRVVEVPELMDSRPRAYAQCVTTGPLVFVAGQVGWDENEQLASTDIEPQVRKAFDNVRSALRAAGADLEDIVSMTVYLNKPWHFDEFLRIRKDILGEYVAASAMIGIANLYNPEMLVEIQATAVRPNPNDRI
jgi:enamine deaminase RidA (YjgF/YER057c/UK114 family)